MNLTGFFKSGFDSTYLFAPPNRWEEEQAQREYFNNRVEMRRRGEIASQITETEADILQAENNANVIGEIARNDPEGSPGELFTAEIVARGTRLGDSVANAVRNPFTAIGPGWITVGVIAAVVYIEFKTGIITKQIQKLK